MPLAYTRLVVLGIGDCIPEPLTHGANNPNFLFHFHFLLLFSDSCPYMHTMCHIDMIMIRLSANQHQEPKVN